MVHTPSAAAHSSHFPLVPSLWVQVLEPDLAPSLNWFMGSLHCSKACCLLGLASFCDFGGEKKKIKAHLRLAVTAQLQ